LPRLQTAIKQIIEEESSIKVNYDLLITVPGIGHLTAVYLICCTNNFVCKITGKQLACYAGVVPLNIQAVLVSKAETEYTKWQTKNLKSISISVHYQPSNTTVNLNSIMNAKRKKVNTACLLSMLSEISWCSESLLLLTIRSRMLTIQPQPE